MIDNELIIGNEDQEILPKERSMLGEAMKLRCWQLTTMSRKAQAQIMNAK